VRRGTPLCLRIAGTDRPSWRRRCRAPAALVPLLIELAASFSDGFILNLFLPASSNGRRVGTKNTGMPLNLPARSTARRDRSLHPFPCDDPPTTTSRGAERVSGHVFTPYYNYRKRQPGEHRSYLPRRHAEQRPPARSGLPRGSALETWHVASPLNDEPRRIPCRDGSREHCHSGWLTYVEAGNHHPYPVSPGPLHLFPQALHVQRVSFTPHPPRRVACIHYDPRPLLLSPLSTNGTVKPPPSFRRRERHRRATGPLPLPTSRRRGLTVHSTTS